MRELQISINNAFLSSSYIVRDAKLYVVDIMLDQLLQFVLHRLVFREKA